MSHLEGYRFEWCQCRKHYPLRKETLNKNILFGLQSEFTAWKVNNIKNKQNKVALGCFSALETPAEFMSSINKVCCQNWVQFRFLFPAGGSVDINTVVNLNYVVILDRLVTMVTGITFVIRIVIQLCIFHWPLLTEKEMMIEATVMFNRAMLYLCARMVWSCSVNVYWLWRGGDASLRIVWAVLVYF